MLAGPSQTNWSNLLVNSSKLPALSAAAEEAEEAEEEEAEGVMILTTTPMPLLPRLQMGSSTGKSPRYSQETEK